MHTDIDSLEKKDHIAAIFDSAIDRVRNHADALVIPSITPPSSRNLPGKIHAYPKVFIPIRGTTRFTCPEDRFDLTPEQICIVPQGLLHHEKPVRSGSEIYTLVATLSSSSRHLQLFHCTAHPTGKRIYSFYSKTYRLNNSERYAQLIDWAADASLQRIPNWQTYSSNLLEAAFIAFTTALDQPEEFDGLYSSSVAHLRNLISMQISDPELSIQSLANELDRSPDHISRIFQRETGQKPSDYIISQRIEIAKTLLQKGTLHVNEVAHTCGYKYPPYFIRAFKQRVGVTPGKWNRHPVNTNPQS